MFFVSQIRKIVFIDASIAKQRQNKLAEEEALIAVGTWNENWSCYSE
jgi:hypothetical protein